MVTVNYRGRLGNNMIQYVAAYIFAKKHNLMLKATPRRRPGNNIINDWGDYFKFPELNGGRVGKGKVYLTGGSSKVSADNFIKYLEMDNLPLKHYHLNGFFQDSRLLYKYKKQILDLFTLKYKQVDENQVFVAYRIGDIEGTRLMLPKEYYIEALDIIKPNGGHITTDSNKHPFVKELAEEYNLRICNFENPLDVLDFAKNFNNLILSEGSFSWWMGFLSNAKKIYYNDRPFKWYGPTLFNFPEWNKLSWDYKTNSFDSNRKLISYKPVKL